VLDDFVLSSAYLGGDVHVLTVGGELDLATVPEVREELSRITDEGGREIVIDLLAVPLVDSVALGLLVETSKRVKARGGALRIVCADRRIARIIEVTGLERILSRHSTLREALESIDSYPLSKAAAR
jgi:anti-sigma B factor antagonist